MPPQDAAPIAINGYVIALNLLALATLGGIGRAWFHVLRSTLGRRPLVDGPEPRLAPWGTSALAGMIGLFVVLNLAVSGLYGGLRRGGAFGPPPAPGTELAPTELMILMAVQNLLLLALIPPMLRRCSFGAVRPSSLDEPGTLARELVLGFRSFFVVAPLAYLLFFAAQQVWPPQQHPVFELMVEQLTPATAALSALSAVVLAPLTEELIFRGVLLGGLTRLAALASLRRERVAAEPAADSGPTPDVAASSLMAPIEPSTSEPELPIRWRPHGLAAWGPNVVVSLLFAGLHFGQWPAPIPLFVLSLALGWLAQRTGRLTASIALHATFNGASTVMMLLLVMSGLPIPGVEKPEPAAPPAPAPAVPSPAVLGPPSVAPGPRPLSRRGDRAPKPGDRDLTATAGDLGFGRQAATPGIPPRS